MIDVFFYGRQPLQSFSQEQTANGNKLPIEMPGATSSFLLLVATPFVTSSKGEKGVQGEAT